MLGEKIKSQSYKGSLVEISLDNLLINYTLKGIYELPTLLQPEISYSEEVKTYIQLELDIFPFMAGWPHS